jgi:hypothetical protein
MMAKKLRKIFDGIFQTQHFFSLSHFIIFFFLEKNGGNHYFFYLINQGGGFCLGFSQLDYYN